MLERPLKKIKELSGQQETVVEGGDIDIAFDQQQPPE
jgi:hypothetical protein